MKNDVRVRYTQMIIKQTLLELLKEKPVNKITVKEICDRSQINRTTFYNHFADVYDIQEKLEEDACSALLKLIDKHTPENSKNVLLIILEEIYKYESEFKSYIKNNPNSDFIYKITIRCFEKTRENIQKREPAGNSFLADPLNFGYFAGGIGGVVGYWIGSGLKETPAELADKIHALSSRLF